MKEPARDIYTIDATGKAPGRLATEVVCLLIGKHKVNFVSNVDGGDHVQVIHAAKMKFSGKKMEQKVYQHHTAFAHGLRTTPLKRVWDADPADVVKRAVSRMLPKNSHRNERLKRLIVKN